MDYAVTLAVARLSDPLFTGALLVAVPAMVGVCLGAYLGCVVFFWSRERGSAGHRHAWDAWTYHDDANARFKVRRCVTCHAAQYRDWP